MAAVAVLLIAGCDGATAESAGTEPAQRAATVQTTGCGLAPERTGSGVAVGDGIVVTVAHLVARADSIEVSVGTGEVVEASVVKLDLAKDLAALRLPLDEPTELELSQVEAGGEGLIVGGAASGAVPFTVKEKVSVSIEEVLGTQRHSRVGYEIDAATASGDSGAGAYDEAGRLIGIVFATTTDGSTTWLTASVEIQDFLAGVDASSAPISCDPDTSRLGSP